MPPIRLKEAQKSRFYALWLFHRATDPTDSDFSSKKPALLTFRCRGTTYQPMQAKINRSRLRVWFFARIASRFALVFIHANGCSTAARTRFRLRLRFFWAWLSGALRLALSRIPSYHPFSRAICFKDSRL